MADPSTRTSCRFYNYGFCKFQDKCKFEHFKTTCNKNICKDKRCYKSYPKVCRYKDKCRRREICLYKHADNKPKIKTEEELSKVRTQSDKYLKELMTLKEDIKVLNSRIVGQKTMLDSAEYEIKTSEKLRTEIDNSYVNQHKHESEIRDKMITNLIEQLNIKSSVQECKECKEIIKIQQDFSQVHGEFSKLKIFAKQILEENRKLKAILTPDHQV